MFLNGGGGGSQPRTIFRAFYDEIIMVETLHLGAPVSALNADSPFLSTDASWPAGFLQLLKKSGAIHSLKTKGSN